IRNMPPELVQWQVSAVLTWQGRKPNMPVYHIHGEKDLLIPIKHISATHIVKNGGHLINITHAQEVNHYIEALIT
ncbi:MAG: alpha/beta fold hydrolase, partial [Burkholderiales bacterium]